MPILNSSPHVRRSGGLRISRFRLPGDAFRCALAADLHLSVNPAETICGFRPYVEAERAVAEISAADPAAMILAGDLAFSRGRTGDYRACRRILEPLAMPLVLSPGNHDHRARLLGVLAQEREPAERVVSVIESGPVRILVLDSLYRSDVVPGLLGQEQRSWLDGALSRFNPKPTVIVVHHPPLDHDNALLDGDRLLAILERHESVQAVFTAHDHAYRVRRTYTVQRRRSLWMVGLPAVGFPFEPEGSNAAQPTGWVEAEFSPAGATLRLRRADGLPVRRRLLDWRR